MSYIVVLADGETFTDSDGVCVYEVLGDLETEEIEESLRSGLVFPPGLRIEGRFHGNYYIREKYGEPQDTPT